MGFYRGPKIVTDGLVLSLDAANHKSYPGSGTVWRDLSGQGNDGTLVNGPTFDSGNNGSIVFDGVNDVVNIPQFVSTSQNLTLSLWFNPDTLPTSTAKHVIYFQAENSRTIRLYANTPFAENNLSWLVYYERENATIGAILPQYTYTLNTWTNTVMVLNENGQYRLYINGQLQNTTNATTFDRWLLPTGFLSLGRLGTTSTGYDGSIANFSIYEKALTPQEILQNYNATKSRFNL